MGKSSDTGKRPRKRLPNPGVASKKLVEAYDRLNDPEENIGETLLMILEELKRIRIVLEDVKEKRGVFHVREH